MRVGTSSFEGTIVCNDDSLGGIGLFSFIFSFPFFVSFFGLRLPELTHWSSAWTVGVLLRNIEDRGKKKACGHTAPPFPTFYFRYV